MNFMRACGFLVLGVVLGFLPHFAPGWCLANRVDGASARGLWLGLMSALQVGIAIGYFLRMVAGGLAAAMRYAPVRLMEEGKIFQRTSVDPWMPAVVRWRRNVPGRERQSV